jgi:hypothetical protein
VGTASGEFSSRVLASQLLATRKSWLFLIVAAIGVWGILEGGRTLARIRTAVVPGAYYDLRLEVAMPVPDSVVAAGAAPGDPIVAIENEPVTGAEVLVRHAEALSSGTPVKLTVTHDGQTREVTLAAFEPSWVTGWIRYLAGVAFVLLGLAVFFLYPGRRESWPFLFGTVAFGVTQLLTFGNPRSLQSGLAVQIGLFAYATVGAVFLHLFAVFPRPLRIVVRWPWIVIAIELTTVALGIALAVSVHDRDAITVLLGIAAVINATATALVLVILSWRLRRAAPRRDLVRLRALVVATAIACPLPTLVPLLASFHLWVPTTDVPLCLMSLAALAFPILVGQAMVRRDLFQIDRAVAHAAATALILGGILLAFWAAEVGAPDLLASASPPATALVALVAVAVLLPLEQRLQRRLLARFVGARLDKVRDALAGLAKAPEPSRFGRFERRLEEALALPDAALLLVDDSGWRRPSTGERVDPAKWREAIELRADDRVLGKLAFGRGDSTELSAPARQLVEELGGELTRILRNNAQGERIGDYRIERFIGAGGMGNVYVGVRVGAAGFVKPVAIKLLQPEVATKPEAVELFLKEARLVARLTHPGIVQTLELGETERGYFIVMEYVEGIDVAALARYQRRQRERLPLGVAAHIVTSACLALDYAHRAVGEDGKPLELVHHDVSPHNLLVDLNGNVKLADFGVAHVHQETDRSNRVIGKLGYLAPEQLNGDPRLDQRVDVFAAGIVLYELVTGQHPFVRGTDFLTMTAIEHARYNPPETLREDCPVALARTISRALAADPDHRFPTAAALAEAIQATLPLDSRHASDLGARVRAARADTTTAEQEPLAHPTTLPDEPG